MIRKYIQMSFAIIFLSILFTNQADAKTITGTEDSDMVYGTAYDDFIASLGGDDIIRFSTGKDLINGGLGFDTIDYSKTPVAIGVKMLDTGTITVTSSSAFGPDATINNVEKFIGTSFDDDFRGYKNDIFVIYQGGEGSDSFFEIDSVKIFASYFDAKDSVLVDLSKGNARSINPNDSAMIGADTFHFVKSLSIIGSNFDDKIIGNNYDNTIEGNGGNDFLDARGGHNVIDGGDGIDYCNYDPRGITIIRNCEIINGVIEVLDSDGDYLPDALDECPFDVNKKTPGINGCGVPDTCDVKNIQKSSECIMYHGGVTGDDVIIIDDDTTSNIEIDNKVLIISEGTTIVGKIEISSSELILNEGCVIFGNIISKSSSITIDGCLITGNISIDGDALKIINSTVKGNINAKNLKNSTVINSELHKNLDMSHGKTVSISENNIHQTIRIMFSKDIEVLDNQIGHKLILYGNEIISIMKNVAEHIVTKYNTECTYSGNMKNNLAPITC